MTGHYISQPFLRTRAGIAFLAFAAIAATFLLAEHWAHVLGVLPLLLPLIICLGMHVFMHGGHGHGDGDHANHPPAKE